MPKKPSAKTAKAKATKLHSQAVRSRGDCECCGEDDYSKLQCAHIISRRYAATRCDIDNAFCLCAKCHWHFTINPIEFSKFVFGTIGEDMYDDLYQRAQAGVKTNADFWLMKIEDLQPFIR